MCVVCTCVCVCVCACVCLCVCICLYVDTYSMCVCVWYTCQSFTGCAHAVPSVRMSVSTPLPLLLLCSFDRYEEEALWQCSGGGWWVCVPWSGSHAAGYPLHSTAGNFPETPRCHRSVIEPSSRYFQTYMYAAIVSEP